MKFDIIRVFARKTKWTPDDELVFIGDVPLFRPIKEMPVKISVSFIQDIQESERLLKAWGLYYSDVQIGGPAYNDPGGEFEPGMFIKKGITITSRGCPKHCPWCFVPKREKGIREYDIKPGYIVQDNNLLACSKTHIKNVFKMLKDQKRAISFNGGLDIDFLNTSHVDYLNGISIKEMWFACDDLKSIKNLERAANLLHKYSQNKKRCYVLMGYGKETIQDASKRVETVFKMGFLPFAQLYKGVDQRKYDDEWKGLARYWSRPAIYKSNQKH